MSKTTKILLKRSSVAGKAPTADIMESGEAFVNLAKGTEHLYFKNAENEVIATKLGPFDKELDETSEYGVENQAIAKRCNELDQSIAKKYNELKKQLDLISSICSIYGFARVNGDNSPDGTIFFGEDINLEEITSHFHMGLTTRDGKLYKKCANCRLDVAADGTALKIDGTDGDVMLVTDSKLYFLKGTVAAPADLNLGDGVELNIIAFGISPFSIYGVNAKSFDPFALNPQYTVNCKIDGVDDVVCAHSIYNTAYAGAYSAPYNWFNETFKPNGNGYFNAKISSMKSIWYAQGKNADQKTNRPYMGGYYEFFEIFIALMFCELKSVYHQSLTSFGTGCTISDPATDAASFGDKTMRGNSGVMYVQANGTKAYSRLMATVRIANGLSASENPIGGLCGNTYGFTEMLEPDRILNDIAKAGLISKIWDGVTTDSVNCSVVFEYDEDGNMKVSDFTNEELATGANMVPNHKYYQVRSVPNTKGMADGAMTAVINIYVKMTFKDGTTVDGVNHTGGYAVYKFSHPVYRGMCLMDGMSSNMQGCHYVNYCIGGTDESNYKYVTYFKCAENVDDIPAQQSESIEYFGDVNKDLEIERGLTKVVQTHGELTLEQKSNYFIWAKKADYNASLLCYTQGNAVISTDGILTTGISTGECALLINNGSQSPNGDTGHTTTNGLPTAGRKCVNAVVVGCGLESFASSARTVYAETAMDISSLGYAGCFSIPHLQQNTVDVEPPSIPEPEPGPGTGGLA